MIKSTVSPTLGRPSSGEEGLEELFKITERNKYTPLMEEVLARQNQQQQRENNTTRRIYKKVKLKQTKLKAGPSELKLNIPYGDLIDLAPKPNNSRIFGHNVQGVLAQKEFEAAEELGNVVTHHCVNIRSEERR